MARAPVYLKTSVSILRGGHPALLGPPREIDEPVERDAQANLEAEAEGEALVHEGGHAHGPAVVQPAQDVGLGHLDVVEVDLVELGVARDLLERLHRHPGTVHVEQKIRDALVLLGLGIGAREEHHPVGLVGERRPHLLAVDDELVTGLFRPRLERGEVGSRVRLGISLAPDLLAREHLGRVAALLLLRPVGNDGGARHADGQDVEDGRRLGERDLFVEDHLLHEGEAAPAVLLGPGDADEAGLVHLALPLPQEVVDLGPGHVGADAHPIAPVLGQVLLEPGADLVPEGRLFGGQLEIHTPSLGRGLLCGVMRRLNDSSAP